MSFNGNAWSVYVHSSFVHDFTIFFQHTSRSVSNTLSTPKRKSNQQRHPRYNSMLFRTSDGSGHRSSAGCLNLPRSNLWAIRLPAGGTPSSVLGYRLRTLSSPSRRKAPKPVCRGAVRIQLLAGPSGYSTFALRFGGAVAREAAYC